MGLVLGGEYVVVVADAAAARIVLQDQSGLFVKVSNALSLYHGDPLQISGQVACPKDM